MANHMSTFVKVRNLNEDSFNRLIELVYPTDGSYNIGTVEVVNRMWKTDFSVKENRYPEYQWVLDNVGAKWIEIECDDEPVFDTDYSFRITSAWHVPDEYLRKLSHELVQIKEDVTISGTYEDESLDPMGSFVFALNYDDIEDLDIEIDFERYWDGEDSDEYREEVYNDLYLHEQWMYECYLESLEEEEDEDDV